ncbi:MAG: hypothetical protein QOE90_1058 [Thermoplasmata archaeon]|jgi:hypothetical protein|nr:hypothetical protein [Thermoplasmata archaeon]
MKSPQALLALLVLVAPSGLANLAGGTAAALQAPQRWTSPEAGREHLLFPAGAKLVGTFSAGHLDLKVASPAESGSGTDLTGPTYVQGETAECDNDIPDPSNSGMHYVSPDPAYPVTDNSASAGQCNGIPFGSFEAFPTMVQFQTIDASGNANGGFWIGDWSGYVELDCYDANSAGGGSGVLATQSWTTYEQNLNGAWQSCEEYSYGNAPSSMTDWSAGAWNGNMDGRTTVVVN